MITQAPKEETMKFYLKNLAYVAGIAACLTTLLPTARAAGGRPQDRQTAADRSRDGGRERDKAQEGAEGTEEGMPQARSAPELGARIRPAPLNWRLGVFAVNTDSGVRITRVMPGSAASRAGLERGDTIVTVEGYQVGYVGSRVYPLGEELQRRAGTRGEVGLLVQNVRNRELTNIDATLDRPQIEPMRDRDRDRDRGERQRLGSPSP
jgi:S1-C subfamily serine protease